MAAMPREEQVLLRLHELLSCLNQRGALTLLISPQSGIDLSHMSDAIPLLRFFEAHGRVRKAPSVIKSRSGGHEDAIRELRTGRSGVRVGEVLTAFRGVITGTPSCTEDRCLTTAGRHLSGTGDLSHRAARPGAPPLAVRGAAGMFPASHAENRGCGP